MSRREVVITDEQHKIIDEMAGRLRAIFVTKEIKNPEQLNQVLQVTEQQVVDYLGKWPDHPAFCFQAGVFYQQTERAGLAIQMFKRAQALGWQNKPAVVLNLASSYKIDHHDDLAEHWYRQAAGTAAKAGDDVDLAHAWHGVGSLYINRGEPKTCIEYCDRALQIDPNDRFAKWNKGIACLEAGIWDTGGELYHKAGFVDSQWKASERKIKTYGGLPEWNGSASKTVICYGEQGVGDEVMFASIIPDMMRDVKVILDVDTRLPKLFRHSFPDAVAVYPTSGVDDPFPWVKDHKIDARIAMGSLLYFYRKKAEDFPKTPYLKADPELRKKWRAHLDAMGPGKHVAISYAGGLKKTRQDMRTINPEMLVDILKIPGIHWHSVQYHDSGPDNAALLGRKAEVPIHHWHDMIKDWDEWAGFLSELDLLITVNTSVHHLAGSLGVPQWCLTPKYVAWRYGTTGPSPFYGNCSMFRQGPDMKWEPVLAKVKHSLQTWGDASPILHPEIRVEPEATDVATGNGCVGGGRDPRTPVAHRAPRKPLRKRGRRR